MCLRLILFLMTCTTSSIMAEFPTQIVSLMDPSVNPCENFYQYACGGWLKSHQLEPLEEENVIMSFHEIDDKNAKVIKEITKENHPVVREFWDSCMNMKTITELGNKPLEKDLKRIISATTKIDILTLAGTFSRTGTNAFLNYEVRTDPNDATLNRLYVSAADTTLPFDYLYYQALFARVKNSYSEYINDLIKLSGWGEIHDVASRVIDVEQQLFDLSEQDSETWKESITFATHRWPNTFGAFWDGVDLTSVKDGMKIYLDHSYLDALEKWVHSISLEDLRLYLVFVMVHSRVAWLGEDFYHVWFKLFGQELAQKKRIPRDRICIENLVEYLPDLIGSHYYRKAFDHEREKDVFKMFKLIQQTMGERIESSTWLNHDDQLKVRSKLDNMLPLIGKPFAFKSYPFTLSSGDYPANMYRIMSDRFDREMKKVGRHVNRMEWVDSTAKVNAYYVSTRNSLVLSAAMLQPPFFKGRKVHPARNFGAIGHILGHEITHGFDPDGCQYDEDGNKQRLWDRYTDQVFKDRSKCFESQYSRFKMMGDDGLVVGKVRGDKTLNENIADNGGVALAWGAYRKYMTSVDPKEYNVTANEGDRMFFLAFGQTWCTKANDESMYRFILSDPHSPGSARVNGVVMNNQDFPMIFNCTSNTPMNPSRKCKIW